MSGCEEGDFPSLRQHCLGDFSLNSSPPPPHPCCSIVLGITMSGVSTSAHCGSHPQSACGVWRCPRPSSMVVGRAGAMAFQHQRDVSGSFPWRRGEVPKRVKLSTWEIVGSREGAADCMECKDTWGLWAAPVGWSGVPEWAHFPGSSPGHKLTSPTLMLLSVRPWGNLRCLGKRLGHIFKTVLRVISRGEEE